MAPPGILWVPTKKNLKFLLINQNFTSTRTLFKQKINVNLTAKEMNYVKDPFKVLKMKVTPAME